MIRIPAGIRFGDMLAFIAIVLLPWQARWIYGFHLIRGDHYEYGVFSVYATTVLLVITLVVFLIEKRVQVAVSAPLLALCLWLMVTSFFSYNAPLSWQYVFIAASAFGYYVLASSLDRVKVISAVIIAAVIQTAFAWYQFMTQNIAASTWLGIAAHAPDVLGDSVVVIDGDRFLRAYGLLPHPNMLGGLLAVALILTAYLIVQKPKARPWLLVLFVWLVSGMLLTFSRSAVIAAGIGFIIVLWYAISKKLWTEMRSLILAGLVGLIIFFIFNAVTGTVWLNRFAVSTISQEQTRLENLSNEGRIVGYYQAFALFDVKTLTLGSGLGSFVPRIADQYPLLPIFTYQPVHNVYLLVVIELGVVGAIFVLWFIAAIVRQAWKDFPRGYVRVTLFSLMIMLLAIGFVDHYLWTSYFGQSLWWVIIGLLVKKEP